MYTTTANRIVYNFDDYGDYYHINFIKIYERALKRIIYSHINGKKHGLAKKYEHKHGKLIVTTTTVNYFNGKKHGSCEEWENIDFPKYRDEFNHRLIAKYHYVDGKMHGTYNYFYKNGVIASESNYSLGKLNGFFRTWDKQNHLKCLYYYKNSQLHGPCKVFRPDGTIRLNHFYINGKTNSIYDI